jgi:hypothetical protein
MQPIMHLLYWRGIGCRIPNDINDINDAVDVPMAHANNGVLILLQLLISNTVSCIAILTKYHTLPHILFTQGDMREKSGILTVGGRSGACSVAAAT